MNQSITLNLHRIDNKKTKATSTLIVDLLKNFDIPGTMAVRLFQQSGGEYLVRKCFLLEYYLYKKKPVLDKRRWLLAAINNNWNESDDFLNWYKSRREYILNNGNDDLKRLVSI